MGTQAKKMDCDGMVRKANNLASKGNSIQNALKNALNCMNNMKNGDAWTGQTYDNLVEVVNLSRSRMNNIIKSVVSTLPYDIAQNARGIAIAGNVTPNVSYAPQDYIVLEELTKTNKGNVWSFDEASTNSSKETVKKYFEEVKSNMTECQSIADSLLDDMNSGSGADKTRELKSAYKLLEETITRLATALDNEVKQQTELFNAAEAYLATKDKIVDAAKDTMDEIADKANAIKDEAAQALSDISAYFKY